tara:strand:- start:29 stop:580 length:552 start_codon:yes stop_codon:yes gene_type:complete
MIASIRQALRSIARPDDEHQSGQLSLSRNDFLRMAAAGTVAASMSGKAMAAATTSSVPPVTDIDALYDAWQQRFNEGDLEALVDLYMEDVTYINGDGILMTGKDKVREDFTGLLSLNPEIVLGNRKHYLYRDVALTTNHWRMNFTNPDGALQELTGGGIEVMAKDPRDGGWRYIIDDASRSAS